MATKQPLIKLTTIGRSAVVVLDKKKYILTTTTKEEREAIKKLVESCNKLPSDTKKARLIKLLTPKAEAKLVKTKIEKKVVKKKIKEATKQLKGLNKQLTEKAEDINPVELDLKTKAGIESDPRFKIEKSSVYLVPFTIAMPTKLVEKVKDFILRGADLTPLINFWKLCLLNPNPIARTKLFDYLTLHNLIITPNGYFVTYRMVKTTDKPGVYTHAHNGTPRLFYEVGKIARLDRATECDEDGSRDCSRGIHFGSPKFIGIIEDVVNTKEEVGGLGAGYGVKTVTTKGATPDSYGTGYDKPATTQTFDQSFGNQATIWLVNPMHVVSIPNSDTRKMRACEGYFAKLTTPEEVIKHVTDPDYLLFDNQYKEFEVEELNRMLKTTKLKSFVDAERSAKTEKAKAIAEENLKELQGRLKISGDTVNTKALSIADINLIIQSRLKKK